MQKQNAKDGTSRQTKNEDTGSGDGQKTQTGPSGDEGGNEEDISVAHVVLGQSIANGVVLHHLFVFFRRNLAFQTIVEHCAWICMQYIPHLSLAMRLALSVGGLFIGVNLDGEFALGIDELDQQWEFVAEATVVVCSQQVAFEHGDQFVEFLSLAGTFTHNGLVAFDSGQFPTLTNLVLLAGEVFEGDDFLASPDG